MNDEPGDAATAAEEAFDPVNTMFKIGVSVLAAYAGLGGLLYAFQRHLIYFPSHGEVTPVEAGLPQMRAVEIETEDMLRLTAWYVAAEADQPTVVYFHGNAGHLGHRAPKARRFLEAGLGLMLVEYRGYGPNPGDPTERGLYRDGRAALAFLESEGVPPARTVLYGESLGSAVAVDLAVSRPCGAVILEAPFTSVADIAASSFPIFPVGMMVIDRFDTAAKIGNVAAPLLVLHGERDGTIPIKHGRALYEAADPPKAFKRFPAAGHNDLFDHGAAAEAIAFIHRHVTGKPD